MNQQWREPDISTMARAKKKESMRNFFVKISLFTMTCFGASWIAASASGINKSNPYPKSLFKTYGAAQRTTHSVQAKETFSGKDVEEVLIEATSTNVTIERSSTDLIEISLSGHYPPFQNPLNASASNGKVEIRLHEVEIDNLRFHINFDESNGGLLVRVPENVRRVTVKTISGDVNAEQMSLKDLAVKTTSGDVMIERSKITELLFQSTSGDLEGEQLEAQKFSGKTVSGEMKLFLENEAPQLEASSTSGDIEFRFRSQPSLNVDFSSVSGEIEVEGEPIGTINKHGGAAFRLGPAKGGLRAKTVSGDLSIKKF